MQGSGQHDCEEKVYSTSLMLCNVSLTSVGYAKLTLTYIMSNWKVEKPVLNIIKNSMLGEQKASSNSWISL